jgi:hypothetical protein
MALPITQPEDFIGEVKISSNKYDEKDLMLYIQRYEQEILEELLGCDLATAFIADLDADNNPTEQRFINIMNPFCIDDNMSVGFLWDYAYFYECRNDYTGYKCKIQWRSRGIRELLKSMIYFKYVRDQKVKNTVTGNVVNQNNVSREAQSGEMNLRRIYNDILKTKTAIQWYICKNPDSLDYDDFNGIYEKSISIL